MKMSSSPIGNAQDVVTRLNSERTRQLGGNAEKPGAKTEKELKKLSHDFESIFIHKLLDSMSKTVPKSGLLDSFASDMYQSMFYEKVADEMSVNKGMGMADMIYRQLSKLEGQAIQNAENKGLEIQGGLKTPEK